MTELAVSADAPFVIYRARLLAGVSGSIKPLLSATEPAIAGGSGTYADASHQHPATITDLVNQAVLAIIGGTSSGISDALVEFTVGAAPTAYIGSPGAASRIIPSSQPGDLLYRVGIGRVHRFSGDSGGSEVVNIDSANAILNVNPDVAPGNYFSRVSVANDATSQSAFSLFKPGVAEWRLLIDPGINNGAFDIAQASVGAIVQVLSNGRVNVFGSPPQVWVSSPSSATSPEFIADNGGSRIQLGVDQGGAIITGAPVNTGAVTTQQNFPLWLGAGGIAGMKIAPITGAAIIPASLQVGATGTAIPAIFVQPGTPTEIDGALWFQG